MTNTSPAPPRDSIWTKYSAHHEFPLASTASLAVHGLLVAGVVGMGIALQFHWHNEALSSPKLDVALVQETPGDGLTPGGSAPGDPAPIENITDPKQPPRKNFDIPPPQTDVKVPPPQFKDPIEIPVNPTGPLDLSSELAKIEKDLKNIAEMKARPNSTKGKQGKGGTGTGPLDNGPGSGIGGPPGTPTERAQILAKRWNFLLGGEPREHVQKLVGAGIKLAFIDSNNLFWVVRDLKQRPVPFDRGAPEKYKDNVQWSNSFAPSINGLYQELGLIGPPRVFVMFLPGDREQVFADAEFKYAKDRNRDLKQVTETWFDFRLAAGGVVQPIVVAQVPFDQRPWTK
jgi:hypothetical protein